MDEKISSKWSLDFNKKKWNFKKKKGHRSTSRIIFQKKHVKRYLPNVSQEICSSNCPFGSAGKKFFFYFTCLERVQTSLNYTSLFFFYFFLLPFSTNQVVDNSSSYVIKSFILFFYNFNLLFSPFVRKIIEKLFKL